MLLVIPSIRIRDGRCLGRIQDPLRSGLLVYDKPEDRARLLRKENAKALHLIFEGETLGSTETRELIERIRQAVDIPIQVSLPVLPKEFSDLQELIRSGIYRLFLPHDADDFFLSHCVTDFTCQKIVVELGIDEVSRDKFRQLRNDGLTRVCITLPPEERTFPQELLSSIGQLARTEGLRLSLLFGVYSYKTLTALASLEPGFDSVILGEALEENCFPCQSIWREFELKAKDSFGPEANLWRNPLQDIPHI